LQRNPETTTSNPGTARRGAIFHVSYEREGADAGYRWYAREKLTPLFAFGHGLSYTRFDYSELSVRPDGDTIIAAVAVRNSGARAGADVAQAYVSRAGEGGFPVRLVGFDKVMLAAGETRRIEMRVDPRLIARFDTSARNWRIAAGTYRLAISRDAVTPVLQADVPLERKVFLP